MGEGRVGRVGRCVAASSGSPFILTTDEKTAAISHAKCFDIIHMHFPGGPGPTPLCNFLKSSTAVGRDGSAE